ncbi:MAG: hypothetical protein HYR88_10795 [Verrucomicrobia bacterium]|nr:hypothetical protein [Verrucomicrobiota bacterium]MBI3869631.1 hypothetical protein [Verrucomicrobiota bacterium]
MTDEEALIERLRLVEALHAGAATAGERDAAASARLRILERLKAFERAAPPPEYTFSFRDPWSKKLFSALLRRYNLKPYRYRRQRHTTVMVRVPKQFVDETLWPEFLELNKSLTGYLAEMTDRVIRESMHADASEPEIRAEPAALPASVQGFSDE